MRDEYLWFGIAAIITGIVLRWPLVNHEAGIDSFIMHNLTNTITHDGSAVWMISPWNFFGAYELSYPVGYPLIVGEISTMTGISVEATILLCSFICGALAAMTSFILALEVRKDPFFGFLISLAYTTAPLILFLTSWTETPRSIFIALLPLTLLLLVKIEKLRGFEAMRGVRNKLLVFLFLDLLLMVALHRLAFMIVIFVFAYLLWRGIDAMWLRETTARLGKRGRIYEAAIVAMMAMVVAVPMIYASYTSGFFDFESFESGALQGDSTPIRILNLLASVGLTIGYPLALTFPIALLLIAKERKFNFILLFFFFSLLLLLPFAGGRIYDRMIYPIILLPLILIPIAGRSWPKIRRNYRKILAVAIAATLPLNLFFVVDHYAQWSSYNWAVNDGNSLSDESYSTGLYAQYYLPHSNFVGNNWVMNMRFQSVSGCIETLNALGPTEGTNLLISGLMTKDQLNYQLNNPTGIISSQGTFYTTLWTKKPQIDWLDLMLYTNDMRNGTTSIKQYNITFMLEDERIPGKITGWESSQLYPEGNVQSDFMTGVHTSMYKMYDNGREQIWLIAV